MPCPACPAERLTSVALAVGGTALTMNGCPACGCRFWERDGGRVPLEEVLDLLLVGRGVEPGRRDGRPGAR